MKLFFGIEIYSVGLIALDEIIMDIDLRAAATRYPLAKRIRGLKGNYPP